MPNGTRNLNEPDVWPEWSARGWMLRCRYMAAICVNAVMRARWEQRLARVTAVVLRREGRV